MILRTGFSLIELIVVIFILSLVGFLVFSEVAPLKNKVKVLKLNSLRETLIKRAKGTNGIEFFCVNKFKKCFIIENGEVLKYEGKVSLEKDLEVYIIDNNNELIHLEDFGRYKDDKINFRYEIYSNYSTSQIIIKNREGVYYMPNYFEKVKKVIDLEEAKALWIKEEYDLHSSDSYY